MIGSDSIVMVRAVPGGPSPKNSGVSVVMTSPSSWLSKVTVWVAEVVDSETLNLLDVVDSCGRSETLWGVHLPLRLLN